MKSLTTKLSIQIALVLAICAPAGVRVSGQVTFREGQKPAGGSVVKGHVIYADTGQPLRRAEVYLLAQDELSSVSSVSDRNGDFVFNDISAGTYYVVVEALDIVSPLSATAGGDRSLKLKVALGQIEDGFSEVTVDGRNEVKTELRASRGGVITGRVLTETEEPIAKAQIRIFQIENGKARLASAPSGRENDKMFETDSRGVYRIAGLATGEYIVRASESNEGGNPDEAAEGSYTNGSMMVAFYPKAVRLQDATTVKVQQGSETKDVDIHFTERIAHRVSGTVLLRGKPVADAEVKLLREELEMSRYPLDAPQASTNDKGQWEIRIIPDGKYTLSVSGLTVGLVQTSDGRGGRVATTRRELIVDGSDVTNVSVELFAGSNVTGTISVEGGTPLPERLIVKLDPSELTLKSTESASERIDADRYSALNQKGGFEIAPLPAGSYQFGFINLGAYYVKSITLKDKDLLRSPIKLIAGQALAGINIVLSSELVSVSGRVVEKNDRTKPLSKATVLLIPVEAERRRISDEPIVVFSDKNGRFTAKSAPGEYFVFVVDRRRQDAFELPAEADLVKHASVLQRIKLERGDDKKVVEVVGP